MDQYGKSCNDPLRKVNRLGIFLCHQTVILIPTVQDRTGQKKNKWQYSLIKVFLSKSWAFVKEKLFTYLSPDLYFFLFFLSTIQLEMPQLSIIQTLLQRSRVIVRSYLTELLILLPLCYLLSQCVKMNIKIFLFLYKQKKISDVWC